MEHCEVTAQAGKEGTSATSQYWSQDKLKHITELQSPKANQPESENSPFLAWNGVT